MSHPDPMQRFLGISSDANPLDVLSLSPEQVTDTAIQRMLMERLEMIDGHPDGGSAEAEQVRAHLRDAAAVLLDPGSRMAVLARYVPVDLREGVTAGRDSMSVAGITEFDREVLGVLVSSGGWNNQSRATADGTGCHEWRTSGTVA